MSGVITDSLLNKIYDAMCVSILHKCLHCDNTVKIIPAGVFV
jgi:hypothetical protein